MSNFEYDDVLTNPDGSSVYVKVLPRADMRLGRNVAHDTRSLQYPAPALTTDQLKSVKHTSSIPVLNQGNIGSCTGNASTKNLSYGEFWDDVDHILSQTDAVLDEQYAVGVYSDAEKIDGGVGYPPDDNGSTGLSVAKVLQSRGLINGYTHALSFAAVQTALQTQAVITGTTWYESMFNTDEDGHIQVDFTSQEAGGHEYVLDEIDVENKRIWIQNSWGAEWGVEGRGYYTFDEYERLLKEGGDCTVLNAIKNPAPQPVGPVSPTPEDKPEPTPEQDDLIAKIVAAAEQMVEDFNWAIKTFLKSFQS